MHGPIRTGLDEVGPFGLLLWREAGRVAFGPGVFQPVGPVFVEAVNPLAQRLAIHAADPRGFGSAHPVQDRSERQQTPALVGVLRRRRKAAQLTGREIRPYLHRCRHGAHPPRATELAQSPT
jgi:hypothetical protein